MGFKATGLACQTATNNSPGFVDQLHVSTTSAGAYIARVVIHRFEGLAT